MHDVLIHHCGHCGQGLAPSGSGRPRRFCSPACKQAAYRARSSVVTTPQQTPVRSFWRTRPRPCRAAPVLPTWLEPYLVCPLIREHRGLHRALVGPAKEGEVRPYWAAWRDNSWVRGQWEEPGPVELFSACSRCLLPFGHTGACLATPYVWTDEIGPTAPDRTLDRVMRVRLCFPSPDIAVPRWHPLDLVAVERLVRGME